MAYDRSLAGLANQENSAAPKSQSALDRLHGQLALEVSHLSSCCNDLDQYLIDRLGADSQEPQGEAKLHPEPLTKMDFLGEDLEAFHRLNEFLQARIARLHQL